MPRPKNAARDVFLLALDTESVQRAAVLDEACAGDDDLRRQVEALLQVHDEPDSFLDNSRIDLGIGGEAMAGQNEAAGQSRTEGPGTRIGPYELIEQIGEGGMGVVFMAKQVKPFERHVAIKIIKLGMDSKQFVARFEAERQALAMMDHPNIAKVFDAGTTDTGRPYFVMELVDGIPVTRFCDEQRLTARERLELFIPICRAVQHAHQKGVIHRDIKPGNILVALYDGLPVAKVIDFGVAKATSQRLTDKTMFTALGQIIGTVEYMSPEQAQQNELGIDTRSDVYSLGIVLYELLVGDTPYDKKRLRAAAIDELLSIIREEQPPTPSARLSSSSTLPAVAASRNSEPAKLNSLVRGKLGWIVMKALEKDRTRRYESAISLAADVEHFLKDEPVDVRAPLTAYQVRNPVRRNQGPGRILRMVTDAALIQLALIGGYLLRFYYLIVIENVDELASKAATTAETATAQTEVSTTQTQVVAKVAVAYSDLALAYIASYYHIAWLLTAICLVVFYWSGFYTHGRLYESRWKALVVSQAVTFSFGLFLFFHYFVFQQGTIEGGEGSYVLFPRVAIVLAWVFALILLVGARVWTGLWRTLEK